jgi:hypothetical protein
MSFHVTKADGTQEFFKVEKLRRSLRRSGASPEEVNKVVSQVNQEIYEGMRTQEIYRRAFEILRGLEVPAAARYSLRRALFGLGPSGFPFEKFLARLFESDGYTVKTGNILSGRCAPHEIDLAAYKPDHSFVGEAKFHARPGIKTDLQVAMYSYARLLDLKSVKICREDICSIQDFWLITNTKFTTTAEKYGECVGVKMLSWDYPRHNNLHDRIQRASIYPITIMQGLNPSQLSLLIDHDIIICRDLLDNPNILSILHLSEARKSQILEEARSICLTQK